jgi:hypothetical protein
VDVVGGVAHMKAVSLAFLHMGHRRHIHHVEGDPIDGPPGWMGLLGIG